MLKETELPQLGKTAKDIHFHGVIPFTEITEVYANAAVCVFPSHMETLGLVALEAMAMQKAVVFTNKGPGSEIIMDGKTGFLCNPHNPSAIAEKIIWALNHKSEARQIGIKAREEILNNFNIKILIQKNIQFYSKIISDKN